jgi:hypothetical protein
MGTDAIHPGAAYRLHFASLCQPGPAFEFPCDAAGRVDLDGLSRRSFNDYLFARALVGWVFGAPSVQAGGAVWGRRSGA